REDRLVGLHGEGDARGLGGEAVDRLAQLRVDEAGDRQLLAQDYVLRRDAPAPFLTMTATSSSPPSAPGPRTRAYHFPHGSMHARSSRVCSFLSRSNRAGSVHAMRPNRSCNERVFRVTIVAMARRLRIMLGDRRCLAGLCAAGRASPATNPGRLL